jgi:ATP-dependent exoDNAse (exonuclease V) alpha subunit
MESKIVVLCDVDDVETDESRSLLYVGMSRARCLLVVLLHKRTKPAVKEAFKKQMSDLWAANL